jgi:hypothetical protein
MPGSPPHGLDFRLNLGHRVRSLQPANQNAESLPYPFSVRNLRKEVLILTRFGEFDIELAILDSRDERHPLIRCQTPD